MTLSQPRSSVPTIGEGGDTTIPSPGMARKQPLPGIRLHDALHDRQACPEFNSFHQGVGQMSPSKRLFSCRPLSKRGQVCYIPPPPIFERLDRNPKLHRWTLCFTNSNHGELGSSDGPRRRSRPTSCLPTHTVPKYETLSSALS